MANLEDSRVLLSELDAERRIDAVARSAGRHERARCGPRDERGRGRVRCGRRDGGLGVVLALAAPAWRLALTLQAAGMGAVGVFGAAVLFGAPHLGVGFGGGFAPAFGVDPLSGFFLVVLSLIAVPAAVFARDALRVCRHPRAVAALSGGFCWRWWGWWRRVTWRRSWRFGS